MDYQFREGEALGKVGREADLAIADVRVGGDDGSGGEVDALSHHVLPEQALLLLQRLPDAVRLLVLGSRAVDELVDLRRRTADGAIIFNACTIDGWAGYGRGGVWHQEAATCFRRLTLPISFCTCPIFERRTCKPRSTKSGCQAAGSKKTMHSELVGNARQTNVQSLLIYK